MSRTFLPRNFLAGQKVLFHDLGFHRRRLPSHATMHSLNSTATVIANLPTRLCSAACWVLPGALNLQILALHASSHTLAFFLPISAASDSSFRAPEATESIESTQVPPRAVSTLPLTQSHRSGPLHNMSISNGQPEATEGQQQAARGGLFANIKSYITSLGLDASHLLTQHAANHHHEDVPADVVKEPEGLCSPVPPRSPLLS